MENLKIYRIKKLIQKNLKKSKLVQKSYKFKYNKIILFHFSLK